MLILPSSCIACGLTLSELLDTERTRAGLIRARRLLESAGDLVEFAPVRKEVLADLSDLRSRGMVGIADLGLELNFREVEKRCHRLGGFGISSRPRQKIVFRRPRRSLGPSCQHSPCAMGISPPGIEPHT